MNKLVRDLMHPGIITCHPDARLGQVAVLLDQHHVHALIVADRDHRPLGIISDFDLLTGEWLSADAESLAVMRTLTAADLMSHPIDAVEANTTLTEAARLLIEKDIHRLLVTDNGAPAGVISTSDFVASFAKEHRLQRGTVADVMSDAILVCRDKTPIASAARTMTRSGLRSVLVVDAKGKPQGFVSGTDFLPFAGNESGSQKTVRDIMHPALTVHMSASLREAADLMIRNHHHRLIVMDEENPDTFPLGVISTFDIIEEMARPDSVWQSSNFQG
jgi:CBS domain-containing protein